MCYNLTLLEWRSIWKNTSEWINWKLMYRFVHEALLSAITTCTCAHDGEARLYFIYNEIGRFPSEADFKLCTSLINLSKIQFKYLRAAELKRWTSIVAINVLPYFILLWIYRQNTLQTRTLAINIVLSDKQNIKHNVSRGFVIVPVL